MEGNKKLSNQFRRRFVLWAMLGMFIVTTLVVGTINIVNYFNAMKSTDSMLEMILENGGSIPASMQIMDNINDKEPPLEGGENIPPIENAENNPPQRPHGESGNFRPDGNIRFNEEMKFTTRFFTANINSKGEISSVNTDNTASISEESAIEIAERLFNSGKENGRDGNYRYKIDKVEGGSLLVYLDCTREFDNSRNLLIISLTVAAASLIVELVLLILLSKRVVKPVTEGITKQKIFVTDASHELKTPLTIISANVEVLELTEGRNEWTDSIKKQTGRMTKLVNDMVYLAKMDEGREVIVMEDFELSESVQDVVMSFKAPAEAKGINLEINAEENIIATGDEGAVRQLISILMDNALKYVSDNGIVRVSLKKKSRHALLEIYNTCAKFTEEDLKRLFDRFYRADKSRSRETGGSGIGLSVAKAIVDTHKNMSIEATTDDYRSIAFKVNFK